jgi:dTDP-4-amino-4,6-dideoxygalactose transaminase
MRIAHALPQEQATDQSQSRFVAPMSDRNGPFAPLLENRSRHREAVDIRKSQREIFEALRADGVGVNLHYIPVYRQPYYERMDFKAGHCPEAERYYAEAISLPMYPGLTEACCDQVIKALRRELSR